MLNHVLIGVNEVPPHLPPERPTSDSTLEGGTGGGGQIAVFACRKENYLFSRFSYLSDSFLILRKCEAHAEPMLSPFLFISLEEKCLVGKKHVQHRRKILSGAEKNAQYGRSMLGRAGMCLA